jgi:CheY-like chemotaxis protein
MNYQLCFLDDGRRLQDMWEAAFETEHSAICWMWIVGGAWALKDNWSSMELWCQRCCAAKVRSCPRVSSGRDKCCIARIPADVLRPSSKAERQQPRQTPLILIVERDDIAAALHESMILDAGFSLGASWTNYGSAERWLKAHNPDAAVLDVKLQDKTCVELAKNLSEREIPFLAVSDNAADTPGFDRIFQSVPWLEKPVTSAGLHLALRSIL